MARPRKAKRVHTHPSDRRAYVRQLPGGSFEYRCKDSNSKPVRKIVWDLEEAKTKLHAIVDKRSKGGYRRDAANHTFSEALDLKLGHSKLHNHGSSTKRIESNIVTLREQFGSRELSEFWDDQLEFFKNWLIDMSQTPTARAPKGRQKHTLAHYKSTAKTALDLAIEKRWMSPPNPFNEFKFEIPDVGGDQREPLTLDEIENALIECSVRDPLEQELTWWTRYLTLLFGLSNGLRPGESCGMCWDMVDLDRRKFWVNRKVAMSRQGIPRADGILVFPFELMEGTKTTKRGKRDAGKRELPMPPLLHAALVQFRERLQQLGLPTEGRVQILITKRTELVDPPYISSHVFPEIKKKIGLSWERDAYAMRTSFANLMRVIKVPIENVMKLMGHTDITTTSKDYYRHVPSYEPLKDEVKEMAAKLGLDRDADEGAIDALHFVLAYRAAAKCMHEGREVPVLISSITKRPPPPSLFDQPAPVLALPPGNVIDLIANPDPIAPSVGEEFDPLDPRNRKALTRARALANHRAGMGRTENAERCHISIVTLNRYLAQDGIPSIKDGRLKREEKQALAAAILAEQDRNPNIGTRQLGKMFGIEPRRAGRYLKEAGRPVPHRPGSRVFDRWAAEIMELHNQNLSHKSILKALKRRHPKAKMPSLSGIGAFLQRNGVKPKLAGGRSGASLRYAEADEAKVRQMVSEGRSTAEMALEMGGRSEGSMRMYLKRLGVQRPPRTTAVKFEEMPAK